MAKKCYERDREIARLKKENKKLRRENAYLAHRIETLSPKETKHVSRERELFLTMGDMDGSQGYFRYLLGRFKLTLVYRVYDRIFFALRKYILASKIWKNIVIILAVFGTSIQALLTFGSVLVLLPTTVVATAILAVFSAYSYRMLCKKMLAEISGKRIYFMFLRKKPRKNGVFYATAKDFSGDGVVFAVTQLPSLCDFHAVRKYADGIYFIHMSFYFTLAKAMKKAGNKDIVKMF